MTRPDATSDPSTPARPPHSDAAAALPLSTRDGLAPIAVPGGHAGALVGGDLATVIRRVAIPAVASNLLMTLFASVDAYWVGMHVGALGLAAVSTAIFWIWMAVSVAEMVGIGLTAVAARRHGERRPEEAARTAGDAIVLAVVLGLAVAVVGELAVDRLFAIMHTSPEVTALGRTYLRTYLLGAPLMFGYFAVDAAFRASGNTRTPFVLLAISVAVTLVLDPVLILGLWGAPPLGVAGAAVATVATRSVACVLGVTLLMRRGLVRFGRPRGAAIASIVRIGLPTAATGVFFSFVYVFLTRTTTQFGTPALAALGLGHRIESWVYMIALGFGATAAAVVGQNLGAGRVDRATRAGWVSVGYGSIPGLALAATMLLAPEAVAGWFTADAAVIAETARYLRIASVSMLVLCSEVVLEGALGGAGATVAPMVVSMSLTAARLPLAVLLSAHWGAAGLWWAISATAAARGVAMAVLWRSGRWKRNKV
ncbi:MAG TPA: MATE family efflux transporter [Gemmatimonadaceae bacterium]|nr:MATE family efflux transporter [Gemmatimonadaceae bacterium]